MSFSIRDDDHTSRIDINHAQSRPFVQLVILYANPSVTARSFDVDVFSLMRFP